MSGFEDMVFFHGLNGMKITTFATQPWQLICVCFSEKEVFATSGKE
jgi:hypothetical protein